MRPMIATAAAALPRAVARACMMIFLRDRGGTSSRYEWGLTFSCQSTPACKSYLYADLDRPNFPFRYTEGPRAPGWTSPSGPGCRVAEVEDSAAEETARIRLGQPTRARPAHRRDQRAHQCSRRDPRRAAHPRGASRKRPGHRLRRDPPTCRTTRPSERRRSRRGTGTSTAPDDEPRQEGSGTPRPSHRGVTTQTEAPRRVPHTCHTPRCLAVSSGHSRALPRR
jgi:hypothetical protein